MDLNTEGVGLDFGMFLNQDIMDSLQEQSSPTESSTSTNVSLPQTRIELIDPLTLEFLPASISTSASSPIFSSDTSLTSYLPVTRSPIQYHSNNNEQQSFLEETNFTTTTSENAAFQSISNFNLDQENLQLHDVTSLVENRVVQDLASLSMNDRYQCTTEISDMKEVADEEILDGPEDIVVSGNNANFNGLREVQLGNFINDTSARRVQPEAEGRIVRRTGNLPLRVDHNSRQERYNQSYPIDSKTVLSYETLLSPSNFRPSNPSKGCRSEDGYCPNCSTWISSAIVDTDFTSWWEHTQDCHKYPEIILKLQRNYSEVPQMLLLPVLKHNRNNPFHYYQEPHVIGPSNLLVPSPSSSIEENPRRPIIMLRQTKQASSQQVQQRQPLTMNQSPPSLSYNRNSYDIPSVLRHHLQPGPVISEFPRPDGKRYSTNNDGPTY